MRGQRSWRWVMPTGPTTGSPGGGRPPPGSLLRGEHEDVALQPGEIGVAYMYVRLGEDRHGRAAVAIAPTARSSRRWGGMGGHLGAAAVAIELLARSRRGW